MRFLFTILLFFISWISVAQADSVRLKQLASQLDRAFVGRDSLALARLLHKDVSFGHSNGWVQTKKDVWNDFASGRLVYKKIDTKHMLVPSIDRKWATVTTNTDVEGTVGGKDFKLTLHVLQVWIRKGKSWQLFARQSSKIN